MRGRTLRSSAVSVVRLVALGAAGAVAASCHEPLDTTRRAPPSVVVGHGLGDDVFGMLCDRVGASSLHEDHTGASYQRVCHYDSEGRYQDKVDVSLLPPVSGERAERARRLGVAKIETMARWRSDLVRAVNAAVPDIEIDNVAAGEGGGKIRLHDAVLRLSQTIAPLYETNPFDPEGSPVLPASTRGMGRLANVLVHGFVPTPIPGKDESPEEKKAREKRQEERARQEREREGALERAPVDCRQLDALAEQGKEGSSVCTLASIWGRRGHRPAGVELGAARAALAYPGLRQMTAASLETLGPGGPGWPALQALLLAGKQELIGLQREEREPLVIDQATAQPSRPRTLAELAGAVALAEDPRFAPSDSAPPSFIARRDRRGFALLAGGVPAPFADEDGDGLADIDASGRFVDASGAPVPVDPPFVIPGAAPSRELDRFGRPSPELYTYIDTSRTLAAAALRSIVPLVDATRYAREADPEPWKTEHEGLMYALAGSYLLYGDREQAQYDVRRDEVVPAAAACEGCLPYRRFRGEDSPLADLAHALGQVLADRDSDALLAALIDLLENHEGELARLTGAALRARDLAREHDRLAAEGKEPPAQIDPKAPLWDEIAAVLGRAVEQPGLVARLLEALASDALLTPHGGSQHAGDAIATMLRTRDQYAYNPDDLNGPALNLTVGAPSTADPRTPVDLTKPRSGDNRSGMQRLMHLMHDTAGVRQCNKEGAVVSVFDVQVPFLEYAECELFQIDNLAAFYLDSLLPQGHDKKAELKVKPTILALAVTDSILESSSGIDGLTSHPTPAALSRLIYFGADSDRYPGLIDLDPLRDLTNETTNLFISGTLEPAGTILCPKNALGVNECSTPENLIRVRHPGTTFLIERLGLGAYLSPIVAAFADVAPDYTGEEILIDLFSAAYRHWPGKDHGPECIKAGSPADNPAYCSEAGANSYEPLLADALQAEDFIASSVAFARTAVDPSAPVTVLRGPGAGQTWTKAQAIEKLARILFSTEYAASAGMVDRRGNKKATWANGKTQEQLTVFTLVADALNGIDARFEQSNAPDAAARRGQWTRATDELIDALLAVEGSGPEARFKNRALPRIGAVVLRVLREQLNARCPDRETTGRCAWAREDLGAKMADLLSHPLFAALVDVTEAIRADEPARRELEELLTALLDADEGDEASSALLATVVDGVQMLANDDVLIPLLKAGAVALSPEGDADGPGAADAGLEALKALNDDRYDRYHAMDHVLPALVTPMPDGRAPLQIFLEAFADVNRVDAASAGPLTADDYRQVLLSARDFLVDETRGLEQIYTIIAGRRPE